MKWKQFKQTWVSSWLHLFLPPLHLISVFLICKTGTARPFLEHCCKYLVRLIPIACSSLNPINTNPFMPIHFTLYSIACMSIIYRSQLDSRAPKEGVRVRKPRARSESLSALPHPRVLWLALGRTEHAHPLHLHYSIA